MYSFMDSKLYISNTHQLLHFYLRLDLALHIILADLDFRAFFLLTASITKIAAEMISTYEQCVPVYTTFQYHPPIVLIWLKYC